MAITQPKLAWSLLYRDYGYNLSTSFNCCTSALLKGGWKITILKAIKWCFLFYLWQRWHKRPNRQSNKTYCFMQKNPLSFSWLDPMTPQKKIIIFTWRRVSWHRFLTTRSWRGCGSFTHFLELASSPLWHYVKVQPWRKAGVFRDGVRGFPERDWR